MQMFSENQSNDNTGHLKGMDGVLNVSQKVLTTEGFWDEINNSVTEVRDGYCWGVDGTGIFLPHHTKVLLTPAGVEHKQFKQIEISDTDLSHIQLISDTKVISLASSPLHQSIPKEALKMTSDLFKENTIPYYDFLTNLDLILEAQPFFWDVKNLTQHYSTKMTPEVFFNYTILPLYISERKATTVHPRYMGDWLTGSNKVFTQQEIEELQRKGIVSSHRIPEEFLLNSLDVRRDLYDAMMINRDGKFETTSQTLIEDFHFLTRSLGMSVSLGYSEGVYSATRTANTPLHSLFPVSSQTKFTHPVFDNVYQDHLISQYGISISG